MIYIIIFNVLNLFIYPSFSCRAIEYTTSISHQRSSQSHLTVLNNCRPAASLASTEASIGSILTSSGGTNYEPLLPTEDVSASMDPHCSRETLWQEAPTLDRPAEIGTSTSTGVGVGIGTAADAGIAQVAHLSQPVSLQNNIVATVMAHIDKEDRKRGLEILFTRNHQCYTPIFCAAIKGNVEALRIILSSPSMPTSGPELEARGLADGRRWGVERMHALAQLRRTGKGFSGTELDCFSVDEKGFSPLHAAVINRLDENIIFTQH